MSTPVLTVNKRQRCDAGCDYDKALSQATPTPKATHQELEDIWRSLVFEPLPYKKGQKHKHHLVRESWVELVG